MDTSRRKAPDNPKEKASSISSFIFLWTYKILRDGYHKAFDFEDICCPMKDDYSSVLGNRLERQWKTNLEKARKKNKTPSLLSTILITFSREVIWLAFLHGFAEIILQLSRSYFLAVLLSYFKENSITSVEEAYFAVFGIICSTTLYSILTHHYMASSLRTGMKVRVACVSLVYRKCLKIGRTALGDVSSGQIVNLISNDVSRFEFVAITINYLWSAPLLTCIVAVILYREISWAGLAGILVVVLVVPMLSFTGKLSSRYRLQAALRTDERIRLTDEVVKGIQVIKMYAWEKPFSKIVIAARKAELEIVNKITFLRGLLMTFNLLTTRTALFLSLLGIILQGDHLTAEKVFVVASYISILTRTVTTAFIRGVAEILECKVSVHRLQSFLLRNEYESKMTLNYDENKNDETDDKGSMNKVFIKDVSASWYPNNDDPPTLNSINCDFKEGTLTGVVGSVGSGKSSFLQLILREIEILKGDIEIHGSISYASQEGWVFSSSIRQNILFGQLYNKKRYKQVIKVCALERDFELLPHGDLTLVGERGASLSGGQKARVNLARAMYRDADIYLLDDPLSAVDVNVGKHLFNNCIKGYLANKTVILVTHQLQYISSFDHVILLNKGSIQTQGSPSGFENIGLDYLSKMCNKDKEKKNISEPEPEGIFEQNRIQTQTHEGSAKRQGSFYEAESSDLDYDSSDSIEEEKQGKTTESEHEEVSDMTGMFSKKSHESIKTLMSLINENSVCTDVSDVEFEAEVINRKGHSVYFDYFRAGSNTCIILIIIALFILTQVISSCDDFFVSYWTRLDENRYFNNTVVDDNIWSNITLSSIQGSLVASVFVIGILRIKILYISCMRSSKELHNKMFNSVIGTPISFFNNNPSGRILNRFSKDLNMVDEWLPKCLLDFIQNFFGVMGALLIAVIVNPICIIPALILGAVSIFVRRFYVKTSKNLKRLEGIARSPVFSHLNSTLQGLTTIRALGAQSILQSEFDNHQDLCTGATFLFIFTSVGFTLFLDLSCCFFVACVTFSAMLYSQSGAVTGGTSAGLAITQAISVSGLLQWAMKSSSEIANQMTSTERVLDYAELPSEESDPSSKKGKYDVGNWPTEGKIHLNNLCLYYSSDGTTALKDICLEIKPREKTGWYSWQDWGR
ncbi:ATP-binding cassette sub-family C member 4-like isoform X2 [Lycorma delicatula]|uniref:ATP-binding cassette sub-family C member 4-like isoform X2 n=1 Tax=Lycorma delicatula TaxID=130591 RepID=UPI003F519477